MSDLYNLKHGDLFLEFTRFIAMHPKFSEQIPDGAEVILLDSRDKGYSTKNGNSSRTRKAN